MHATTHIDSRAQPKPVPAVTQQMMKSLAQLMLTDLEQQLLVFLADYLIPPSAKTWVLLV